MKPKADWRAVDSPQKKNKQIYLFFAVKSKRAKKTKKNHSFIMWENLRRANLLTVLSDL
jgi:hypothetical protein